MLRIVAPHFVAGVQLDTEGLVVEAAPILWYMQDWAAARVYAYCRGRGWRVETIDDACTPPPAAQE